MKTAHDTGGRTLVFVDSCAVNRFALLNVDPTRDVDPMTFAFAITPDLEREYCRALDHLFVPPYVKALLRRLLAETERLDPEGPLESRTRYSTSVDATLIELARHHLVITDDTKQCRRFGTTCPGLIPWSEVEAHLKADRALGALLRTRSRALVDPRETPEG